MCKTKAAIFFFFFFFSFFFSFSFFPLLCFFFLFFLLEEVHLMLCIPEQLCRHQWTPGAKQGLLCYWGQQGLMLPEGSGLLNFFPSCGKEHKCLGGTTEPGMDLGPHFQPYSDTEAERAGFKTDCCGNLRERTLDLARRFSLPTIYLPFCEGLPSPLLPCLRCSLEQVRLFPTKPQALPSSAVPGNC